MAADGRTPRPETDGWAKPLGVSVADGRLTIEIGIGTLTHAVTYANWANPWSDKHHDYIRTFAITDHEQFAKDVRAAMLSEREDGSSPLTDFIDRASEDAVNDGSLGLDEAEHVIKYGKQLPIEVNRG